MVVVAVVTVTFIIIGDINKLAPIVTMPFLITYASIDYSYFALAQTFDLQHRREMRYEHIHIFCFIFSLSTQHITVKNSHLSILCYKMYHKLLYITLFLSQDFDVFFLFVGECFLFN